MPLIKISSEEPPFDQINQDDRNRSQHRVLSSQASEVNSFLNRMLSIFIVLGVGFITRERMLFGEESALRLYVEIRNVAYLALAAAFMGFGIYMIRMKPDLKVSDGEIGVHGVIIPKFIIMTIAITFLYSLSDFVYRIILMF